MSELPATVPANLYLHQAERLVHELGAASVDAEIVPLDFSQE
jgi:hypothetical protein